MEASPHIPGGPPHPPLDLLLALFALELLLILLEAVEGAPLNLGVFVHGLEGGCAHVLEVVLARLAEDRVELEVSDPLGNNIVQLTLSVIERGEGVRGGVSVRHSIRGLKDRA